MSKITRWEYIKDAYNSTRATGVTRTGSIVFHDEETEFGPWFFADVQTGFPGGEELAKQVVEVLNGLLTPKVVNERV